jgi:hypothetical protein
MWRINQKITVINPWSGIGGKFRLARDANRGWIFSQPMAQQMGEDHHDRRLTLKLVSSRGAGHLCE